MADARLELLADSSQIRTAKRDLDALNATGTSVERTQKGMQSAVKQTGVNMQRFSRSAGQAGIQIQQFTGQVSTGTNSLVALSQQAADLGIVLGAPLIGVFASLAATALLMAQDTEEAASASDRLKNSLEALDTVVVTSGSGIKELSAEIQKLAEYSDQAARAKITLGLIEARDAAKAAADSISESLNSLDAGFGFSGISDFVDAINSTNTAVSSGAIFSDAFKETARELGEEFGLTGSKAQSLGSDIIQLIARVQSNPTPENFERLNQALLNAQSTAPKTSDSINRLIGETQEFFSKARTAAETTEFLNKNLDEITGGFEGSADKAESAANSAANLTANLQAQIIALQSGAQAAELYAAEQSAIANGTESQLPKIRELINRKYELKEAQAATAEAAKLEIEQQKAYESVLDQIIAKEKQKQAAQASAEANRISQLQNVASGTIGLTDLQALEQQYQAENDLLKQAQAEGIASKISYEERLTQLQQEYADKRNQIIRNEANNQSFLTDSQMNSISLVGDAFGNMAAIAEKGGKDSFETYKAFATAQAITSGILATMGTLAQASLYFAPPVPQILAGTVAALSAVNVAQIQSQTYQPRAVGGSVYEGSPYLVGELGPELFTPNSSGGGRITPFNQLMNKAGGESNTVTENTTLNLNLQGVYNSAEDMIVNNRDLIVGIIADYKRRKGEAF